MWELARNPLKSLESPHTPSPHTMSTSMILLIILSLATRSQHPGKVRSVHYPGRDTTYVCRKKYFQCNKQKIQKYFFCHKKIKNKIFEKNIFSEKMRKYFLGLRFFFVWKFFNKKNKKSRFWKIWFSRFLKFQIFFWNFEKSKNNSRKK